MDRLTLLTLVLMALSSYLSRFLGYVLLHGRRLSPRMQRVMESVPGCVLISVIAPVFVSSEPATLLGLLITLAAATRLSLLPTVIVGVVATGALRHLL